MPEDQVERAPADDVPADAVRAASAEGELDPDAEGDEDPEGEDHELAGEAAPGLRYTADLSDAELERRWVEEPASLGTISVGFTDAGRIINAEPFPQGEAWTVSAPQYAWAVRETIEYMTAALNAVHAQFPDGPSIRVNHISRQEGGWLRPHRSHQGGRDVDLSFYYRPDVSPRDRRHRKDLIDPARCWALIRALATLTDVQLILVDRQIIKVIHDYALRAGEDRAWVDSLFSAGHASLVRHARRHRDHFHVRFFAPRSQELGRRIQPLLAGQPEQNVALHRVRSGDTLGALALRYGTTVAAIRKANGMRSSFLSLGRVLNIPLRKPCTRCPLPPEVVVPPRRLPPEPPLAEAGVPPASLVQAASVSAAGRRQVAKVRAGAATSPASRPR